MTAILEVCSAHVAVETDVAVDQRVETNRFRVSDVFQSANRHAWIETTTQ